MYNNIDLIIGEVNNIDYQLINWMNEPYLKIKAI